MSRLQTLAAGGLLAALVGCNDGPTFSPVSGIVKLDGQPYPNAVVTFQPVGGKGNNNPGRGSSAYTDEAGRFVLKSDNTTEGAVVGTHLVRIMTRGDDIITQDPETGSSDFVDLKSRKVDPIPPEWNSMSKVEFDVPPGGTDQANFDINGKKRR